VLYAQAAELIKYCGAMQRSGEQMVASRYVSEIGRCSDLDAIGERAHYSHLMAEKDLTGGPGEQQQCLCHCGKVIISLNPRKNPFA